MSLFIKDDFMLNSQSAVKLYKDYAEKMPIFDFHSHLNPDEILKDKKYTDLTDIWLLADHYKWRLMRANGVEEKYITGEADNYEKFLEWASTISKAFGNPLYHWTHLELKRYFGIDTLLNEETAPQIWRISKEMLGPDGLSARELLIRSNVKAVCTTDDPIDDLESHRKIAEDQNFSIKVLPTFRPEKALGLEGQGFLDYILKLESVTGAKIDDFDDLVEALKQRAEFFKSSGCVVADVSFESPDFTVSSAEKAKSGLKKVLNGEKPDSYEIEAYRTELMLALGRIYHKLGFVMQMHLGVERNYNTRMFGEVGPDRGFDAIGESISSKSLAALLDGLAKTKELPKTVIYCLDDKDNNMIISLLGCYQEAPAAGKLQLGSAWWFNDHLDGMRKQLKTTANFGLLSTFIGMLTDSRSFLSFTRHEYFRRILCDLLGGWMESGQVPMDYELLGEIVKDICFNNAVKYFNINF